MKIKDGVILSGLDVRMRPVLAEANKLWVEHGQELVVTSGLEGVHSAGSLHYYGLALDFRIRYFTKAISEDEPDEDFVVQCELEEVLSTYSRWYDVLLYDTHIHVEYDLSIPL